MTRPAEGEKIRIASYKYNGQFHREWQSNRVLKRTDDVIIVGNDQTIVTEHDGSTWTTNEPAICYFYSQYWFNIISMLRPDGVYYYCNMSSPFQFEANTLKYVDYDLDIKVYPDMTFVILDEDEYEEHKRLMQYPASLDATLQRNKTDLLTWIRRKKGPFAAENVNMWYKHLNVWNNKRTDDF
ncbi:MAG TPA: DUF402 domain-containing protein [Bacillota bacterium]|nr:DUF402 domain-containing protein [Bacillota bacterium]